MKIKMKVLIINTGRENEEEYDINNDLDPTEYAQNLINNFNNTLRPNESPRKLMSVEVIQQHSPVTSQHDWEKTNLVTLNGRKGLHDILKCSKCGITSKRYGFSSIVRDVEYGAKAFDTCEGAITHMKKLKERRER